MAADADFIKGVTDIINKLGSGYSLSRGGAPGVSVKGIVTKLGNDSQLVNAVGIEASVFYCKPLATPAKKFDRLTDSTGKVFIVQSVHLLLVLDKPVINQMVVKA